VTPEVMTQINEWRQKLALGQLTIEDQRAIVAAIRQGRLTAAGASEQAKRTKAKTQVRSAADILAAFGVPK